MPRRALRVAAVPVTSLRGCPGEKAGRCAAFRRAGWAEDSAPDAVVFLTVVEARVGIFFIAKGLVGWGWAAVGVTGKVVVGISEEDLVVVN